MATLKKRIDFLEAHLAGMELLRKGLREDVNDVVDQVNAICEKAMAATATRKSLNIGDEQRSPASAASFRKERAEDSLVDAVSGLLSRPSRNGHQ